MTHAISTLQIALDTARNNEPIHRTEGRIEQADKCRDEIHSFEVAIHNLQGVEDGDFIPAPATPEYRLLDEGEPLELTDEWLAEGCDWVQRAEVAPGEVLHLETNGGWHLPHRRRLNA